MEAYKVLETSRTSQIRLMCGLLIFIGIAPASGGERHTHSHEIASPLRRVAHAENSSYMTHVETSHMALATLQGRNRFRMNEFVLTGERRVALDLQRFDVFTPDALVVAGMEDGSIDVGRPDVVLLRGTVAGEPNSSVFLSFSRFGNHGAIRTGEDLFIVASDRGRADGVQTVVYDANTVPEDKIRLAPFQCFADDVAHLSTPAVTTAYSPAASAENPPARYIDIAVETDHEFVGNLFGGDTEAAAAYAATLIGGVSEIFQADFNATLRISYLRLWPTAADPWDQGGTGDQLGQFRDYWLLNMEGVERHLAHFLSGRGLGGGVAWLPGLCNGTWGFGLSANLGGGFPYPLQDNHWQNWDPFVVAHELGHNFGAPHTHGVEPPIDTCASGGYISNGTIMSYCHTCGGGMNNIRLAFHERTINESVLPWMAASGCDFTGNTPVISRQPEGGTVCTGESINLDVAADGGEPLSFQWRRGGVEIPGETSMIYSRGTVTTEDSGQYDVVVSNAFGQRMSSPTMVHVLGPGCRGDVNDDGSVDIFDILCVLDGFTNQFTTCSMPSVDIFPCEPDGKIDIFDILAVLDAFAGMDACLSP